MHVSEYNIILNSNDYTELTASVCARFRLIDTRLELVHCNDAAVSWSVRFPSFNRPSCRRSDQTMAKVPLETVTDGSTWWHVTITMSTNN